jgi:hypothetical protein
MLSVTRRGLFAVGGAGAASLAVAACGTEDDPRAEGRDADLLLAASLAEAKLGAVYDGIAQGGKASAEVAAMQKASQARLRELVDLGAKVVSEPPQQGASMADVISTANPAIAAYRELVRFGSKTDLRSTAIQFLTQVAGEQATSRTLQNQDPSPVAFVTGLEEEPYIASNDTTSTTTTSSPTTSSTTSTTTSGG